nr:immunoglobulin heavy chain junction region [Macaca mulatta]MOW75411.1 immunoglobulin heavy chain junction region [Macaca mulatta]MOW75806.1 immunoglobulin heavy chain junction region [Macaca mulatta]MOW75874.1 immunoglobulin heavy chain junction region [Macaca mulatta]MOW75885.1 immunoglobulin heavy chain junction region [Macaca mulatta]
CARARGVFLPYFDYW